MKNKSPIIAWAISIAAPSLAASLAATFAAARAQDVPGIEICTRESRLDRRTSCLQSNVQFLQQELSRNALDAQQKLGAAARDLAAFKDMLAAARADIAALKEFGCRRAGKDQRNAEGAAGRANCIDHIRRADHRDHSARFAGREVASKSRPAGARATAGSLITGQRSPVNDHWAMVSENFRTCADLAMSWRRKASNAAGVIGVGIAP